MNLAVRTLHYSSQQTYNFTQQPWNGVSSMEDFYNSFEVFRMQMLRSAGELLHCNSDHPCEDGILHQC